VVNYRRSVSMVTGKMVSMDTTAESRAASTPRCTAACLREMITRSHFN
jgi:hypothetical protein